MDRITQFLPMELVIFTFLKKSAKLHRFYTVKTEVSSLADYTRRVDVAVQKLCLYGENYNVLEEKQRCLHFTRVKWWCYDKVVTLTNYNYMLYSPFTPKYLVPTMFSARNIHV